MLAIAHCAFADKGITVRKSIREYDSDFPADSVSWMWHAHSFITRELARYYDRTSVLTDFSSHDNSVFNMDITHECGHNVRAFVPSINSDSVFEKNKCINDVREIIKEECINVSEPKFPKECKVSSDKCGFEYSVKPRPKFASFIKPKCMRVDENFVIKHY